MESEIKEIRPKEISSFDLGERESKHGEERRKEEEEEEDHRYGNYGCMEFEYSFVWKSSFSLDSLEPSILCTVWV